MIGISHVTHPQLAAHLEARLLRQHQVEHNEVGQLELRLPEPFDAVKRRYHLEPLPFQVATQNLDQRTLILNHQYLLFGHLVPRPPSFWYSLPAMRSSECWAGLRDLAIIDLG